MALSLCELSVLNLKSVASQLTPESPAFASTMSHKVVVLKQFTCLPMGSQKAPAQHTAAPARDPELLASHPSATAPAMDHVYSKKPLN
eukprot:6307026-Amphidinium_carterae.1